MATIIIHRLQPIYSQMRVPSSSESIQGVVMGVFRKDRELGRITLLGSSLSYSQVDAISKAIALLHAPWLFAGLFYPPLKCVLSKVISLTTDFGLAEHRYDARLCLGVLFMNEWYRHRALQRLCQQGSSWVAERFEGNMLVARNRQHCPSCCCILPGLTSALGILG